ncbi:hypothetical protein IWX90DRAFT_491127 [Phyllosticta citrichinensis]|uniref:BTB domain-containing protein n=1 Tax=Phyllosticta citrichinensis TaxID=1130410 RepID=A0ABR1Y507_9PEZI
MALPSLDAVIAAQQKFRPLLSQGIGMDLELRFGTGTAESVKIHKELLFLQCPIFKSILEWRRESNRNTKQLHFVEEHPLIINALVIYLYEGRYDPPALDATDSPLLFHLDLSDAAEMWGLLRLKCVADECFMKILLDGPNDLGSLNAKLYAAHISARENHDLYRQVGKWMGNDQVKELVDNKDFRGLREKMRANLAVPVRRVLQQERVVVYRCCFSRQSE